MIPTLDTCQGDGKSLALEHDVVCRRLGPEHSWKPGLSDGAAEGSDAGGGAARRDEEHDDGDGRGVAAYDAGLLAA